MSRLLCQLCLLSLVCCVVYKPLPKRLSKIKGKFVNVRNHLVSENDYHTGRFREKIQARYDTKLYQEASNTLFGENYVPQRGHLQYWNFTERKARADAKMKEFDKVLLQVRKSHNKHKLNSSDASSTTWKLKTSENMGGCFDVEICWTPSGICANIGLSVVAELATEKLQDTSTDHKGVAKQTLTITGTINFAISWGAAGFAVGVYIQGQVAWELTISKNLYKNVLDAIMGAIEYTAFDQASSKQANKNIIEMARATQLRTASNLKAKGVTEAHGDEKDVLLNFKRIHMLILHDWALMLRKASFFEHKSFYASDVQKAQDLLEYSIYINVFSPWNDNLMGFRQYQRSFGSRRSGTNPWTEYLNVNKMFCNYFTMNKFGNNARGSLSSGDWDYSAYRHPEEDIISTTLLESSYLAYKGYYGEGFELFCSSNGDYVREKCDLNPKCGGFRYYPRSGNSDRLFCSVSKHRPGSNVGYSNSYSYNVFYSKKNFGPQFALMCTLLSYGVLLPKNKRNLQQTHNWYSDDVVYGDPENMRPSIKAMFKELYPTDVASVKTTVQFLKKYAELVSELRAKGSKDAIKEIFGQVDPSYEANRLYQMLSVPTDKLDHAKIINFKNKKQANFELTKLKLSGTIGAYAGWGDSGFCTKSDVMSISYTKSCRWDFAKKDWHIDAGVSLAIAINVVDVIGLNVVINLPTESSSVGRDLLQMAFSINWGEGPTKTHNHREKQAQEANDDAKTDDVGLQGSQGAAESGIEEILKLVVKGIVPGLKSIFNDFVNQGSNTKWSDVNEWANDQLSDALQSVQKKLPGAPDIASYVENALEEAVDGYAKNALSSMAGATLEEGEGKSITVTLKCKGVHFAADCFGGSLTPKWRASIAYAENTQYLGSVKVPGGSATLVINLGEALQAGTSDEFEMK